VLCTPHDPAHLELLRASTLLDAPPAQRIEAARPHLSKQYVGGRLVSSNVNSK